MKWTGVVKPVADKFLTLMDKEVPFLWTIMERTLLDSWSIANDLSQHYANQTISPKYISHFQNIIKEMGLFLCQLVAENPILSDKDLFVKCIHIFSSLQ